MNWIKDAQDDIAKELKNKWFVGSFIAIFLIAAIVGFWYYTGSDTRESNRITDAMSKIETAASLKIESEKPDAPLEYKLSLKASMLQSDSDYQHMKDQYSEIAHGSNSPLYIMALTFFFIIGDALGAIIITLLLRYLYTALKFDTKDDALLFYKITFPIVFIGLVILEAVMFFYKIG